MAGVDMGPELRGLGVSVEVPQPPLCTGSSGSTSGQGWTPLTRAPTFFLAE